MSGAVYDRIIGLLNVFGCMQIVPDSNIGTVYLNQGLMSLDFMALDGRLRTLESSVGVVSAPGSNSGGSSSITIQITNLQTSVTDINNRLANATANAICVGNTVVTSITI